MTNSATKTKKQRLLKLLYDCEDNLLELKYSDNIHLELRVVIEKIEKELQDEIQLT